MKNIIIILTAIIVILSIALCASSAYFHFKIQNINPEIKIYIEPNTNQQKGGEGAEVTLPPV